MYILHSKFYALIMDMILCDVRRQETKSVVIAAVQTDVSLLKRQTNVYGHITLNAPVLV